MKILIVSTSLNSKSRSLKLAATCGLEMSKRGCAVKYFDLQKTPLPLCDGETSWEHPSVKRLQQEILEADAVVIAAPIYNWSVAASTKNFVECAGHALDHKVVALLCAAGGPRALLAPMNLASCLMVDFQALIVPKIVVVESKDSSDESFSQETTARLSELVDSTLRVSSAMAQVHQKAA